MQYTDKIKDSFVSFSLDLLKKLPADENVTISPLSVLSVLAMSLAGTGGQTNKQIKALFGGMSEDEINAFMYRAENIFAGENVRLAMANGIFVNDEEITLKEDFVNTVKNVYDGEIRSADFSKNEEIEKINLWVKEKTNGLIEKITEEDMSRVVMLIVNALAFDGKWTEPFLPHKTFGGVFYGKTPKGVDFMNSTENRYFTVNGGKGFVKPYFGGYSFAAILPDEGSDVNKLCMYMSNEELKSIMSMNDFCRVDVTFPYLDINTELELKEYLAQMGVTDVFDACKADFSRMCTDGVYADNVIHRCALRVDENGTEAAAVTSMGIMRMSMAPPAEHKLIFDRPFVFIIYNEEHRIPVFMGLVADIA